MKKQLLFTLLLLISLFFRAEAQCNSTDQCAYNFIMTDSWGDGWNGQTMTIRQNGANVATIGSTFTEGSGPVTVGISLCPGPFELFWNDGGLFPSEIGITIENPFSQIIYTLEPGSQSQQDSTIFSGTVNCLTPVCLAPTELSAAIIDFETVELSWSNDFAAQWELIIQTASLPAPTAADTGMMVITPSFTATGIETGIEQKFFVRSHCPDAVSDWSVHSFITTCVPPSNLSATALGSGTPILEWVENGAATEWEILIQLATSPPPSNQSTGVLTTTTTYDATGLVTNTDYKFFVRAICSANAKSNWGAGLIFTPFVSLPPIVTNSTDYTPTELISNILINNPCIAISNVTSSTGTNFGSVNGLGYFTNSNPTFPISSGIVLSTGSVANAPGPNSSNLNDGNNTWLGDTELQSIISAGTGQPMVSFNATKLEFDFTSQNEYMSFNFLFASDEYGTYQCEYADAFAFLLTDMVSGVTTNLAVVPGTTIPVSVVTIRDNAYNTSCTSANPGFFDTYFSGPTSNLSATNYNGQTALMTASSAILPNHPYHIKLVVADRGDSAFDSSVFIEAGSFSSGPPACSDKIQLVAFIDQNSNGVKDIGENNFTYGNFTTEVNNDGVVNNISSPIGTYTLYDSNPANMYDFGFQINPEYANYYAVAAANYNAVSIEVGSGTQILNFPITLTQAYSDVQVVIVPVTPPVAGGTFVNRVEFTNLGVAVASGTINFLKDPAATITSTTPAVTVNPNGFSYGFSNLQPYESRSISIVMSIPAIPVVNIDDILSSTATIYGGEGDLFNQNDTYTNSQVVVASYDPNDKMESHGGQIPFNEFSAQDYLFYTVRFQNTGTSNAISVRIEDLLDSMLDEHSIRVVSASHDYVMQRVGNQIIWNFDYIQLPPMLQDEELSQGYVTFKIKLKAGFSIGDIIPNSAEIYFDSNPAIVTNVFNTEFVSALATVDFDSGDLLMYPNPASSTLHLRLVNGEGQIGTVVIYDMVGKSIISVEPTSTEATIDVSSLSKGVYLVEISNDQLKQVRKLIIN